MRILCILASIKTQWALWNPLSRASWVMRTLIKFGHAGISSLLTSLFGHGLSTWTASRRGDGDTNASSISLGNRCTSTNWYHSWQHFLWLALCIAYKIKIDNVFHFSVVETNWLFSRFELMALLKYFTWKLSSRHVVLERKTQRFIQIEEVLYNWSKPFTSKKKVSTMKRMVDM